MKTKEDIRKEVQDAVKEGRAVMGYRESLELINNGNPKTIIIANNAPESRMKEIRRSAELSSIELEIFDGDSKELGLICGKPFPILVLAIKE